MRINNQHDISYYELPPSNPLSVRELEERRAAARRRSEWIQIILFILAAIAGLFLGITDA